MVTHSSTETADLRRDVIALREWKEAVLDCCKACDGFDALQWGGDKDGWGFVMFFISHLNTRALRASLTTASGEAARAPHLLDTERSAFENWWMSRGKTKPSRSTEPGYTDQYATANAEMAWRGWRARGAAQPSQDEMENYRLALAWIKGQSTDPQAKEIAATALDAYSVSSPTRQTGDQ